LSDADGDGIADKDDECPTEAGLAKFNGCRTDSDGIADKTTNVLLKQVLLNYKDVHVLQFQRFKNRAIKCLCRTILFETGKATIKTQSAQTLQISLHIKQIPRR
jgi:hypothetical protein